MKEVRKIGRVNEATNVFMTSMKSKEKSVEFLKEKQKSTSGNKMQTCTHCHRTGHSEAKCYRAPADWPPRGSSGKPRNSTSSKKKKKIKELGENSDGEVNINRIIDRSAEGRGVKAELLMQFNDDWMEVTCDVDTGAGVCIIGNVFLCAMLGTNNPKLENSSTKLGNVSKDSIKVLGLTYIRIRLKKKVYRCEFQVVDINHGPLLSANASKTIGLVKFCNKINTAMNSRDVEKIPEELKKKAAGIIKKYRDVFEDTLGKFPGKVSLHRDPKVMAVHEKPRRFPNSKKKILQQELEKLIAKGVITKQD